MCESGIRRAAGHHRSTVFDDFGGATRRGEGMKSQANFVERREQPRVGVMAQLGDITYSVLRKHGIVSGSDRDTAAKPIKE
jgi:hypothetical protein